MGWRAVRGQAPDPAVSSAPTAVCGAPQPLHRAGPLPEHGGARGPGGSVSSPLNRLSRLYPAPHPPLLWSCRATTGQTSVEGQATSSSSTPQRRTGKVRLPLRRARRCWGRGGAPRPTEAWTRLALVPSPPALSGSELPSRCCWLTVGGAAGGRVARTQSQRLGTPAVSLSGSSVCR